MHGKLPEVDELPIKRLPHFIKTITETVPYLTAKFLNKNYAFQNHDGNSAAFPPEDEDKDKLDPQHEDWEIKELYNENKCQYAIFSIMDPGSYLYDSS